MNVRDNLAKLGIVLPSVAAPVASYVPATVVGSQVWTSGQLPFVDGELAATGLVGDQVSLEEATGLARTATLNALAAIDAEAGLERVARILKVTVFVASDLGFKDQAQVANGASELMAEVFGEAGRHVRSAIGVAVLPLGSPIEVEVVAGLDA